MRRELNKIIASLNLWIITFVFNINRMIRLFKKEAKQIKFAGYPSNGEFEYDGDTEVGLNNSKPVYIYEYQKGGKQYRVILQF